MENRGEMRSKISSERTMQISNSCSMLDHIFEVNPLRSAHVGHFTLKSFISQVYKLIRVHMILETVLEPLLNFK